MEGSYFGDSDIFSTNGKERGYTKNLRDCTAISVVESQLLVITRKDLLDLFEKFKPIEEEMREVGLERKNHHIRSIKEAIERN